MADDTAEPPWWPEHLPVLGSLALVGAVLVRVLILTRADPATTVAVIRDVDALQVAMATAVPLLPTALIAGANAALQRFREAGPEGRAGIVGVNVVAFALLAFVVEWYFFVAVMLVQSLTWTVTARPRAAVRVAPRSLREGLAAADDRADRLARVTIAAAYTVWLLVVSAIAFWAAPWLPLERLELTGRAPVVGFVVAKDADDAAILVEATRTLLYVPAGEVRTRTLCTLSGRRAPATFAQLVGLSGRRQPYPRCAA